MTMKHLSQIVFSIFHLILLNTSCCWQIRVVLIKY